jgi:hypothetical protein
MTVALLEHSDLMPSEAVWERLLLVPVLLGAFGAFSDLVQLFSLGSADLSEALALWVAL